MPARVCSQTHCQSVNAADFEKKKGRLEAGPGRRGQTYPGHSSDELATPIVLLLSLFIYKLFIDIFWVKISMSLNEISDWLLGCDGPVYAC